MKRLFEIIGLLSLACFSFFITEKTTSVFENIDNIMIQIKENSAKYEIDSMDAIIDGDTIIPGMYGRVVDIKKSYKKMRNYGIYNENMYVYKNIKPNVSLMDNMDKYIISGNKRKRNISLIFIVDNEIDDIINTLDNNNIKANFFIDDIWFNEHNDLVMDLIKNGHIIGNLSHNLDYSDSSFGWMDTIIKSLSTQKQGYCYYTDKIDDINKCNSYKNYIIKPIEINNNFLLEVKKHLDNGIMFSFKINTNNIKELNSIINFIKSKGYNIVNIEELLSEKNDLK